MKIIGTYTTSSLVHHLKSIPKWSFFQVVRHVGIFPAVVPVKHLGIFQVVVRHLGIFQVVIVHHLQHLGIFQVVLRHLGIFQVAARHGKVITYINQIYSSLTYK